MQLRVVHINQINLKNWGLAVGEDEKVQEAFGETLNFPPVKVYYARNTEQFVPLSAVEHSNVIAQKELGLHMIEIEEYPPPKSGPFLKTRLPRWAVEPGRRVDAGPAVMRVEEDFMPDPDYLEEE